MSSSISDRTTLLGSPSAAGGDINSASSTRRSRSEASPAPSLIRRSVAAVQDLFPIPFSSSALASLPKNPQGRRERAVRIDNIPDEVQDESGYPTNYQSIDGGQTHVRVPKKTPTLIKVEAKVWFANERTWLSYLNVSILLGTMSAGLYNASTDNVARNFAYAYALISMAVLLYGYFLYQRRVTLIRRRDPGHFDAIVGPVLICVALFIAVLTNFIIRAREFYYPPSPAPSPSPPT